jgi:myo-inositol-1(or 4)-monophosphatase
MHPMLNIAVRAARSAGNVILRHSEGVDTLTVREKSLHDFVSEVDSLAEQAIIGTLRRAYPDHAILAEESGVHKGSDYEWVIDPLDGTTNFLHGFPQFAVSIALRHRGIVEQAVVFDPLRNELFTASRGSGAFLNDRRIRVSKIRNMDQALLGTGFPFRKREHLDPYLGMLKTLFLESAGVRRAGSAALDLAYVAAGRLDGFWELGLSPWDMAAGTLLIVEAGGMVGDFSGGEQYLRTGNVVTGNPKTFPLLLQAIRPHLTDALQA